MYSTQKDIVEQEEENEEEKGKSKTRRSGREDDGGAGTSEFLSPAVVMHRGECACSPKGSNSDIARSSL